MDPLLIESDGTSLFEIVMTVDPIEFDVAQGSGLTTCSKFKPTSIKEQKKKALPFYF